MLSKIEVRYTLHYPDGRSQACALRAEGWPIQFDAVGAPTARLSAQGYSADICSYVKGAKTQFGLTVECFRVLVAAALSGRRPTETQDGDVTFIDLGHFNAPGTLSEHGTEHFEAR